MRKVENSRYRERSTPVQGSTPGNPSPSRSSRATRFLVGLCLILSLLSLALSAFILNGLLNARQAALERIDAAIAAVEGLGERGYEYDFPIDQEIPISVDMPIKQEMTFPVEGTFPINTTVEVPFNAGILGSFVVEVPISTSIDVETSVPIKVEESFHIETTVPISMTIPIEIRPDDPGIDGLLQGIRRWLEELREAL